MKEPKRLEDVQLGATYQDVIHKTKGVAIGVARYLTGCDQVCLSRSKEDGDVASDWFDVNRIKRTAAQSKAAARLLEGSFGKRLGGPQSNAPKGRS